MSIDIWPDNFLYRELRKLKPFQEVGSFAADVQRHRIPAWKAAFMETVYSMHSQYGLPRFEDFVVRFTQQLLKSKEQSPKLYTVADGRITFTDGFLYRLAQLYEGGMGELFVYSCLVKAIEDHQIGLVCYDARIDWKYKIDALVHIDPHVIGIDIHYTGKGNREFITDRRLKVEQDAKRNIYDTSSHWFKNHTIKGLKILRVTRSPEDCMIVNGFHLYSQNAINTLISDIFNHCNVPEDLRPDPFEFYPY